MMKDTPHEYLDLAKVCSRQHRGRRDLRRLHRRRRAIRICATRAGPEPGCKQLWLDNRGNLFVEVEGNGSGGTSVDELPRNGSKLRALYLNVTIHFPGGVAWDGTNLDLDDQLYISSGGSGIYQIQVQGSTGTMTGEFALPGSCGYSDVVQPWVQGSKIIGADTHCGTIGIDTYPGGANQTYLTNTQYPIGATVSKAKI